MNLLRRLEQKLDSSDVVSMDLPLLKDSQHTLTQLTGIIKDAMYESANSDDLEIDIDEYNRFLLELKDVLNHEHTR